MTDIGASVLARLRNKALQSGRSYQLCLQLFCQEEFLRRVAKSNYADNLVLKGGLFLYALTDFDSRVTVDIDFLACHMPNTPERLREALYEIIAISTGNDFVKYEVVSIAPIALAKKYSGVSSSIIARIKNTRTPFGIDFGFGDIIIPHQEKRKLPTQLNDFEAPVVNTYSVETTVAEKLDAIMSLMEYSSRMKDYYDIYYLANKFDFDGSVLTEAMLKTFQNRERLYTAEQFERAMSFATDTGMQKKWKAFTQKIGMESVSFSSVMNVMKVFLGEPFSAIILNGGCEKQWSATENAWNKAKA